MKFNATTSTLFQSIMEKAAAFFGLDKDSVTETEVDAALEAEPLSVQLEAARELAIADLKEKLDTLTASVSGHEEKITDLENRAQTAEEASVLKDARISELQVEVEQEKTKLTALSTQHRSEVSNLAGELAKAKAGIDTDHDEGGGDDAIAKKEKENQTSGKMVVVQSSALKKLTQPSAN